MFDLDHDAFAVTYRLAQEPRAAAAVLSSRTQRDNGDGTFTVELTLHDARRRGLTDEEGARRIIAITHPGYVDSRDVVLVSAVAR